MKTGEVVVHLDRLVEGTATVPGNATGLVVGEPGDDIHQVVVARDVDEGALDRVGDGCLLVSYRAPPGWRSPAAGGQAGGPGRRMLALLLRRGIALYLVPAEYARVAGGLADRLAEMLALDEVRPFGPGSPRRHLKLVVFVPQGHEQRIREALAGAGAGHIGRYSHCTFQVAGTGTFLPLEGAGPFAGKVGALERVEEFRLETVLPEDRAERVVDALLKAHPYEEVAYDLYPLVHPGVRGDRPGRIGLVRESGPLEQVAGEIARRLGTAVRVAGARSTISRVALVPGAGSGYWEDAVAAGADMLVTGDIPDDVARAAVARGLSLADPGAEATEAGFAPAVVAWLRAAIGDRLQVEAISPPKLWWLAGR